jgi:hypothetical protein
LEREKQMSKQLTGALFVDIQGDNKNLKKSLNDSKQSVSGFGAAVQTIFAANPALAAILGVGGTIAASYGLHKKLAKTRQQFHWMKNSGHTGFRMARNMHRQRLEMQRMSQGLGILDDDGQPIESSTDAAIAATKARLTKRLRQGAARETVARRIREGGTMNNTIRPALMATGAFLKSGAGLMMMSGVAASVIGILGASALKRGNESRQFDVSSIREDAATQVARIKQNMQIAKSVRGQGFKGSMERMFDEQMSNGMAANAESTWNTTQGVFWGIMSIFPWVWGGMKFPKSWGMDANFKGEFV